MNTKRNRHHVKTGDLAEPARTEQWGEALLEAGQRLESVSEEVLAAAASMRSVQSASESAQRRCREMELLLGRLKQMLAGARGGNKRMAALKQLIAEMESSLAQAAADTSTVRDALADAQNKREKFARDAERLRQTLREMPAGADAPGPEFALARAGGASTALAHLGFAFELLQPWDEVPVPEAEFAEY